MRLEEEPDLGAVPAQQVFQDRHQDAERVVAQYGARRHLRNVAVLRYRDGETVQAVYVEHDVKVARAVPYVYQAIVADGQAGAQLVHHRHLAVAGRQPHDGFDLAAFGMVAEAGSKDVIGRHHAFERRFNDLLRRGGNHVEREMVAVDIVEQFRQHSDVGLQAHALADFNEVLAANLAELGIVQQQVGEFPALLYQVNLRQAGDPGVEILHADHARQNVAGIVKTEGLVEIAKQEIASGICPDVFHLLLLFQTADANHGYEGGSNGAATERS